LVYKRILVPYDISKPADNALEEAVKLKESTSKETEVILLHIIQEIPVYPVIEHAIRSHKESRFTTFEEHTKYVYSSMKQEVIKILQEKNRKYEQLGLRLKVDVIQGKPVDKILEYAEIKGIDLIIMGSTGLGGIAKLAALGSVSRGVMERARCPVMIVH
jgi:nucleotide-binding universal stress UspA family protein